MQHRITFPYGNQEIEVKVPVKQLLLVLKVRDPPFLRREEVIDKVNRPIKSDMISQITSPNSRVVILVSDITRPVPNKVFLPAIIKELTQVPIPPSNITIIVATGLHRSNTRSELQTMLGQNIVNQYRVINHNALDAANSSYISDTSRGTPIHINKEVVEADSRIATGYIEPHEFAGFTGGRKSILPGVAGIHSINHNHSLKMISHPNARIGVLDGNPIHEDMIEAATHVGVDYIVNVVLNSKKQIAQLVSGDFIAAHTTGVRFLKEYSCKTIDCKADIVIASTGYPLDIDLYQTVKAAMTAEPFVKKGGSIILLTECREGFGPHLFEKYLTTAPTPTKLREISEKNYRADVDHCIFLSRILQKSEIIIVTANPSLKKIDRRLLAVTDSIQEALKYAQKMSRPDATILAVPYAQRVIPTKKTITE